MDPWEREIFERRAARIDAIAELTAGIVVLIALAIAHCAGCLK